MGWWGPTWANPAKSTESVSLELLEPCEARRAWASGRIQSTWRVNEWTNLEKYRYYEWYYEYMSYVFHIKLLKTSERVMSSSTTESFTMWCKRSSRGLIGTIRHAVDTPILGLQATSRDVEATAMVLWLATWKTPSMAFLWKQMVQQAPLGTEFLTTTPLRHLQPKKKLKRMVGCPGVSSAETNSVLGSSNSMFYFIQSVANTSNPS